MFSTSSPIPSRSYPQPVVNTCLPSITATCNYSVGFGISAGGQSFVLATWLNGATNYNLLLLNGNRSTLAFGGVKLGTQKNQTATEYNIGNLPLTLGSPFYTTNGANAAFSVLGSTTCGDGLYWIPPRPATSMSSSRRIPLARPHNNSQCRATDTTAAAAASLLRSSRCGEPAKPPRQKETVRLVSPGSRNADHRVPAVCF